MSVVIARSVSDEAIWKQQCLNGGERLLRFARNDMLIRELAIVTDEVKILVVDLRIKGQVRSLTVLAASGIFTLVFLGGVQ
jgi:hypothetical protein